MEIEVLTPSPPVDFNFDSTCTSPYISASSSPQRFSNFFFSAPTSPTRISHAEVPFNWEEKPGVPKSSGEITGTTHDVYDDDFAFDFSGQLERSSVSAADELFDGGKIKPLKLKPPPKSQYDGKPLQPPRSPKQRFKEVFSPRPKKKELDPFAAAIEQTRAENIQGNDRPGRERTQNPPSSSRHKKTRSLSPFRVSDLLFDRDSNQENTNISDSSSSSSSSSSLSSLISLWYRKWKLKDLFLFRSASEGRASNKDHLKKFMKRTQSKEDVKNSSFRSTGSSVGSSVSSSIRRREVSAHELHYTLNRAFSEEMKRKTFLPYRNGVLGCLGFIPTMDDSASYRGGAAASMSMSMSRR